MYKSQAFLRIRLNLILLIFLLMMIGLAPLSAQKLEISAHGQQTVMGLQSGYQVAAKTDSGFGLGVFIQSTHHFSLESSSVNYPFYGADLIAPITSHGDLQLLVHLKSGLVNNRFWIIAPEVETRWTLSEIFSVGLTAAVRSRQAAVGGKLTARVL